jgi:Putative prokaryotic signal transducing protein
MAAGPDPREQGDSREARLADSIQEVVVARYDGQPEAEMWAELLRNEGVPTAVIQLLPGARLAWGMVPCELRVRSTDLARARTVLGLDP